MYLSKRHGDKVSYKNGAVLYRGDQFHIDFLQILLDTDICLLPYNDHHLDKESDIALQKKKKYDFYKCEGYILN